MVSKTIFAREAIVGKAKTRFIGMRRPAAGEARRIAPRMMFRIQVACKLDTNEVRHRAGPPQMALCSVPVAAVAENVRVISDRAL